MTLVWTFQDGVIHQMEKEKQSRENVLKAMRHHKRRHGGLQNCVCSENSGNMVIDVKNDGQKKKKKTRKVSER